MIRTIIYMRYTDKNGDSYVRSHFVWDTKHFVSTRGHEAEADNGKAEQITEEQYNAEKKSK